MSRIKDMAGGVIGRWTVIARAANNPQNQACWTCRCECGTIKDVFGGSLRKGISQSCGCLTAEVASARSTTHGEAPRGGARSAEYLTWGRMISRCTNKNGNRWRHYGGRGIVVCDRWRTFENFLMDMGRRPSSNNSIDRYPDKDGNYEPGNCRWATSAEQANNKRNNRRLTIDDESLTLAQWARQIGINKKTTWNRAQRAVTAGWMSYEHS